ncbi:hypothetical protein GCM10027590_44210 [Nocardiopsis nanhaiensis]
MRAPPRQPLRASLSNVMDEATITPSTEREEGGPPLEFTMVRGGFIHMAVAHHRRDQSQHQHSDGGDLSGPTGGRLPRTLARNLQTAVSVPANLGVIWKSSICGRSIKG